MIPYEKGRPESLQELFSSIASDYDRTNGILSLQLHRLWNRALIKNTIGRRQGALADLCCGTGAIALTWLKKCTTPQQATLIDFCPEMLKIGKEAAKKIAWRAPHQISFLQADVQSLPLPDCSVDFVTIAYGIRNVSDPRLCFTEVRRVLKHDGVFGILELTEPTNRILRLGHRFYLNLCLPLLGQCFASNRQAYRYLSQSIPDFTKPAELALQLQECGFQTVQKIPLTGSIATLFISRLSRE